MGLTKPPPHARVRHLRPTTGTDRQTATELSKRRRAVALIHTTLEKTLGRPRQAPVRPSVTDILIATILSQNTNDRNSHRAYTELRRRFPRWVDVARAPARSVVAAIRTGGMARQKGPRIQRALCFLWGRYGTFALRGLGRKSNREITAELTQLDGVGIKTASCVLLFSLGRNVFPVDTHIHRVCGRLGVTPGCRTPEQTFEAMAPLVRAGTEYSLHTNLIRFGRRICRARDPLCAVCPLSAECAYPSKTPGSQTKPRAGGAGADFMLLDNVGR